jgi:hypothetical protein
MRAGSGDLLGEVPETLRAQLLEVYEPDAARAWLGGINPMLGDRSPIDLLRAGRLDAVLRAIRADRADSFN